MIKAPGNSGSTFRNYKKTFSIILMAVADANCRLLFVDIGAPGGAHDVTVFEKSTLWQKLTTNEIGLPPKPADGIPLHFLSDTAFGLQERIMKPYPDTTLDPKQKIFNYRLSRARRTVESTFGIMANRFRYNTHLPLTNT